MDTTTRAAIEDAVMEAVAELTTDEVARTGVSLHDKPIGDLGLDSPAEIEFICLIEAKLGIEIDGKVRPLVNETQKRGRTVQEVIDFLCELLHECKETTGV